ncbi:MAG: type IIA DNA topoisomerase subunit B [Bacteroidales bacterium]|nr:type IIA DNA topoisomerase subunit B [Bacteroidales bacterium]
MAEYQDDNIVTLNWDEHIRTRPGMYIGKLGDGSSHDDGIYVLLKEVIDNSIDEFMEGHGRSFDITIKEKRVTVRDYGRGIPLNKVVDCVSKMNTGGKFKEGSAFEVSIGMNGVGVKAVNALSTIFVAQSVRDGKLKRAEFSCGKLVKEYPIVDTDEKNGTLISFLPDDTIFENFDWYTEYIDDLLWNYVYLNRGLTINFNGRKYYSKNGLLDLLNKKTGEDRLYEPIYLTDDGFEFAMVHTNRKYGEEYYTFVNSQYTAHGGTHQQAMREAIVKTCRDFYKKNFEPSDIRNSVAATMAIRVKEPIFDSQTKTKLGSDYMTPGGQTIRYYVNEIIGRLLDNYLHKHSDVADIILKKIQEAEKERTAIANLKKQSKEIQKKVSLHNSKLRDCRYHFNTNDARGLETMIFITEGDSASGSITQSRDANTQAVFSLMGKPANIIKTKSAIYENKELSLLQAALNLEDGIEGLRYNNIVIATDADVDGMHIRLLLLAFFIQLFPDVVRSGHVYVLQTPLFRVRNPKKTIYCYSEQEKVDAIKKLGQSKLEITRFKGLGEIDPKEFKNFIGKSIRLEPVVLDPKSNIDSIIEYYMGKNSIERQNFIIENLREEIDNFSEES